MRRLLLLPVLALVAMMFVASPASAATVDTFAADTDEAQAGGAVTLSWSVSPTVAGETVDVVAAGSAVGTVPGWQGSLTGTSAQVTLPTDAEPGDTFEFAIEALEANQAAAPSSTVTVTVVADPGGPTVVAPAPVTIDGCEVVVPQATGVVYGFAFFDDEEGVDEDEDFVVPSGRYPVASLTSQGEDVVLFAAPQDGFAFEGEQIVAFALETDPDCFPTFVDAEAICKGVTFTNVSDVVIRVYHDDFEDEGEFTFAPGETRTVDTTDELVFYVAGRELEIDEALAGGFIEVDAGVVEVDQDCTRAAAAKAAHPTVAPAAGSDASGPGTLLGGLALLGAAAAAGAALHRRRAV